MKGGWQKIMTKNTKYYGVKEFFPYKRKISLKFIKYSVTHFGKMYLAKPLVKLNIKECLSLDLLNFVSIDDFPFYMRWKNAGVTNLNSYHGYCYKKFLDF